MRTTTSAASVQSARPEIKSVRGTHGPVRGRVASCTGGGEKKPRDVRENIYNAQTVLWEENDGGEIFRIVLPDI